MNNKLDIHSHSLKTNSKYKNFQIQKPVEQLFQYKDKTGRGIKETLTKKQLSTWKEMNYDGEAIAEWIKECEEGDIWENAATKLTCLN